MPLVFATRPSALARWQTQWVIQALQKAWPSLECREEVITTQGDRILDRPLPEIGGKGLFTQELEAELLSGKVHAAVHSLKDLPVENAPGLTLGAIPTRAEPRDVLISAKDFRLDALPQGAVVGTSSLRRSAQLLAYRPDLKIESLRGNVDTRMRKAREGQYDAIILAGAGVTRLELQAHVTEWLPFEVMLPAPGQGALAVQCRAEDEETLRLLEAIEDGAARRATEAERAFLMELGGGCSVPVAAFAICNGTDVSLTGRVISLDGERMLSGRLSGPEPLQVGADLARKLMEQGAGEILHG